MQIRSLMPFSPFERLGLRNRDFFFQIIDLRGQFMRNRPKRVATKSPILLKILLVIGLYVQFYM